MKLLENETAIKVENSDAHLIVSVKYDGSVVFGDGITPTEAAEEFWRHVGHLVKERTKHE